MSTHRSALKKTRPLSIAWAFLAIAAGAVCAQPRPLWWVGFIDANDRAFLEVPGDAKTCADRDILVRNAKAQPGALLPSRLNAASQLAPDARLTFGVVDLAGRARDRVMTRIVAIARDNEGQSTALLPTCWLLAEAGSVGADYRVLEDRLAIGVHPPRAVAIRVFEDGWRSYGLLSDAPGADGRFAASGDLPAAWRERAARRMPHARQVHAQRFSAILDVARGPEELLLLGATDEADMPQADAKTYNASNFIVRESGGDDLYQAPVGRSQAGFVAQVVAAVDLDGDGVDELIVRARYFAGGNLKVLKWSGGRFFEVRQTGYDGD